MYTHEVVKENRWYEIPRRYPRFLISVPVTLARSGQSDMPAVHGMSLDLSRGGASAVLCGPPAVGETVRISLHFLGASLQTLAIVRHSDSTHCGFEFISLSPAQREQLDHRIRAPEERRWPWRQESAKPSLMPCHAQSSSKAIILSVRIYPNALPTTLFGYRTRDRPLPHVTMPRRFRSAGGRGYFRFPRSFWRSLCEWDSQSYSLVISWPPPTLY